MPNPILKRFVPLPKPSAFTEYLFIGPHPDDIEVGCAPTVRRLVDMGKRVHFLIMTDGGGGSCDPSLSGRALIETRRREATASAQLLGVMDVTFLTLPDGGPISEEECAAAICREIVRIRPEAVFAPDPDVVSECHLDHLLVGRAVKTAVMQAPYPAITRRYSCTGEHTIQALFFYNTDRPNAFLPVGRTFHLRRAALELHKSQFTQDAVEQIVLYYTLRSLRLGLARFCGRCDGYRALSLTHMHCFPEASRW